MVRITKKVTAFFLALLFIVIGTKVYAVNEFSWYIKRNGHELPKFPNNAEKLYEYNAYFIDKKAYTNKEKIIYLTFDAGYENGNIEKILDVLKEEKVSAAFFILDNIIYKNPELVKRMSEEGHFICNHTKKHKNLCACSQEKIKNDLSALEELCYERTGVIMAKYFRFPEGKYSLEALEIIKNLGYKTFFWSFGYDDWDNARQPNIEKSKDKILSNTHDGEIILLHPTSDTNAKILRDLIKEWRNMGYSFGTLDQLVERNS